MQKGYKPSEVVDAVVRAINPGMQLRRYLEGLENLTLPHLRRILRSHYQEKSATELYWQLSTLVQEPQEGLQSFLIRALDTRQNPVCLKGGRHPVKIQPSTGPGYVSACSRHWSSG